MIPKEFLGAFKCGHRPESRQFIDEELSLILLKRVLIDGCENSRKHLEYITKFNNEFHKNVIRKDDQTKLHNTDELRRDCYARENAKNRDIFSKRYESSVSLEGSDGLDGIDEVEFETENDATWERSSYEDYALHKINGSRTYEDILVEIIDISIEKKKYYEC